jgi:hypothetical protein
MTKQQVANNMLKDFPWDGTELVAPLTLPGALLASSYVEQKWIATPANPPVGSLRLYPKADGKYYQLDSAGNEQIISGQSQAQNDTRYLQLTGGTLTGPLTLTNLAAQNIAASGSVTADGIVANTYKWTPASDGESLYKEMPGRLRLSGAMLTVDQNLNVGSYTQLAEIATPVTPNTGQVRLYAKTDHKVYIRDTTGVETDLTFMGLTLADTDARYPQKTDVDPYPQYVTEVEGDARYASNPGGPSGGYLTVSAAAATYLPLAGGTLTGNLLFSTDNTKDIGDATHRPRDLVLGRNLVISGSGPRILADFSSAPNTNRLMFQTSVAASGSYVGILPSADDQGSAIICYEDAVPANSAYGIMWNDGTQVNIGTGASGAGIPKGLSIWSSGEKWRIPVAGHLLAGANSTYDIGDSGGTGKPRDLFVGRDLFMGRNLKVDGYTLLGSGMAAGANQVVQAFAGGNSSGDQVGYHMYSKAGTLQAELWTDAAGGTTRLKSNGVLAFHTGAGSTGFTATNQRVSIDAAGAMNFGVASPPPFIRANPGATSALDIQSPTNYLMLQSKSGTHMTGNLYWDGTNWQRYDTAAAGSLWIASGGLGYFYSVAAGANPASLSQRLSIDNTGALIAAGNITGRWLYTSDGSNGVLYAGAGDLYLRTGSAGNTYRFDTGANIVVAGGATFGNHVMISQATGGIGSGGGSEGQLELQNAGSGASKIAFHRVGAYAAYLGLDTDNVWAVGGWSMGAIRYPLHHDGNYPVSQSASGSTLVQRTVNGYIYCNYINCTADVPGGKPAYVWGDNGDAFARRWPISAVGPPSLWNWSGGNGAGVTVPYTGYYRVSVVLRCVGGSNCGDSHGWNWIYRNGGGIFYCDWNDALNGGGASGIVLCNAGDTLSSNAGVGTSFSEYTFWATFCPSSQYPGN